MGVGGSTVERSDYWVFFYVGSQRVKTPFQLGFRVTVRLNRGLRLGMRDFALQGADFPRDQTRFA